MPRKGENIYQRKDGRWEGRYIKERSSTGAAIYGSVYAPTYTEVRKKRNLAIANVDPGKIRTVKKKGTVETVALEWLDMIKPQVKNSTYCKYHYIVYSYVLPGLGKKDINKVSVLNLQNFCDGLLTKAGSRSAPLSTKTVSDILAVVKGILNYASIYGYSPSCTSRDVFIRKNTHDIITLSDSDQKILCRYLFENPDKKNLGILICLFTGIRLGELCALKWEDISLYEKTIYIRNTMQRLKNFKPDSPKTYIDISSPKSSRSIRKIPLPNSLFIYIQQNFPEQQGFILSSQRSEHLDPRTIQNHFKKVQKKLGLEPVNFHALRHTFATRSVELGFDIKSLSEILGHASVIITMNRYVHPSMELKQQNMQKISILMDDLMNQ